MGIELKPAEDVILKNIKDLSSTIKFFDAMIAQRDQQAQTEPGAPISKGILEEDRSQAIGGLRVLFETLERIIIPAEKLIEMIRGLASTPNPDGRLLVLIETLKQRE